MHIDRQLSLSIHMMRDEGRVGLFRSLVLARSQFEGSHSHIRCHLCGSISFHSLHSDALERIHTHTHKYIYRFITHTLHTFTQNLTILNLGFNNITAFPAALLKMTRLKELHLNDNKVTRACRYVY